MANRRFTQFFNTLHKAPTVIDCSFKVALSDSGGLGVTGLRGRGVQQVFMKTSATPLLGNPNPANGIIIVQLTDSYSKFFGVWETFQAPLSGSNVTTTVSGVSYVITTLGTATLASWQLAGVPKGIQPAVGVAFTAIAAQALGGSAAVQVIATAGTAVDSIEVFGTPDTSISVSSNYSPASTIGYPQIMFQTYKAAAPSVVSAPADNTVISLSLFMSNSSAIGE